MKITGRIPLGPYAYVELEESNNMTIEEMINLVNQHYVKDEQGGAIEVVMDEKNCPKCGAQLLEQISVSSKTKKPYHRIKCINNRGDNPICDYIQWVNVSMPKNV